MKVTAVVLTGFLGAGKTTLLNRAMAVRAASVRPNEGKLGIIVNELGAIGVDGDLLPKGATRQVELPGGCVCCVLNDDLERTVKEMLDAAPEIDTLIIETTGVAEPLPIVWALEEAGLRERLRVAAVVTVVDPTSFATARAASVTAEVQVESADVVMLSKSDVAAEGEVAKVRAEVERLAGKAPVVEGTLDERATWLLGVLADPEDRRLPAHAHVHVPVHDGDGHGDGDGHDHHHGHVNEEHHGIDSVALVVEDMVDLEELEDALAELPGEYVRVKGILRAVDPRTGSQAPGWVAVHRVGSRVSSETVAAPEGGGRLVALGPGVREAPLRAGLARAVLSSTSSE
jgi:G3E family GTPase